MAEEPAGFSIWVVGGPNNPADYQVMEEVTRTLRSIFVRMVGKVGQLPTPWMEPGGLETQSACNAETLSVAPLAACELHSRSNFFPPDRLLCATSHFWLLKCRDIDNLGGLLL